MDSDSGRVRRSSRELRELVLRAARSLFQEKGFAATSTRDIAREANVAESVVFRHFRTKSELFDETMIAPFTALMEEFVRRWTADPHEEVDPVERGREYVTELYRLCMNNREMLRALTAHPDPEHAPVLEHARATISKHVEDMTATMEDYLAEDGGSAMDLRMALRLTMALVMGTAVFDHELFAEDDDRDTMPDLMYDMVLFGVQYRPPPGVTDRVLPAPQRTRRMTDGAGPGTH
jgi:AcrR family transcriptional regulator